jgi:hypothetical protein
VAGRAALSLGPIGLGGLTEALASIGQSPDAKGMSGSSWQVAVCQLILSVAWKLVWRLLSIRV